MKIKKKQIILLVLVLVIASLYTLPNVGIRALTYEGSTNEDSGGITTYVCWFQDYTGLIIVSTDFDNNSGIVAADITVTCVCRDPNQLFRLRIYDSDTAGYVNPDKEMGKGKLERRFSVRPHIDKPELIWTVEITDTEGLSIFAKIVLIYKYDENAQYKPVGGETETGIPTEQYKKDLKKQSIQISIGSAILVTLGIFAGYWIARRVM